LVSSMTIKFPRWHWRYIGLILVIRPIQRFMCETYGSIKNLVSLLTVSQPQSKVIVLSWLLSDLNHIEILFVVNLLKFHNQHV
jgi:hypothetical protein